MEGLAVIIFPVLLMFFALSMERVEARLSRLTLEEDEVEKFFDQASTADVNNFVREGFPRAIKLRQRRRRRWRALSRRRSDSAGTSRT